jgi:hypothetical protein
MYNLKLKTTNFNLLLNSVLFNISLNNVPSKKTHLTTASKIIHNRKKENKKVSLENLHSALSFSFTKSILVQHVRLNKEELLLGITCLKNHRKSSDLTIEEKWLVQEFQAVLELVAH